MALSAAGLDSVSLNPLIATSHVRFALDFDLFQSGKWDFVIDPASPVKGCKGAWNVFITPNVFDGVENYF